jgi:CP family cyanate transporter-like MFS transporter
MTGAHRTGPMTLTPIGTAWDLTVHFGLTSGVTFTIMGWLPSMLRDRSQVAPSSVGWLFTIAMALGVPVALRVPKWARRSRSQSALAVALALPAMIAVGGLLFVPTLVPLAWAIGLGLGMPAVGLALAAISLRADTRQDTAAALSSMVQGFGYAIAGTIALGAGLLHSITGSWEWPLAALLIILVAQAVTGTWAGRPITIYSMPKGGPLVIPHPRRSPE